MRNFAELFFNRLIDRRMPVTVEIRPNRGIRVQILPPATVPDRASFPSHNDDRLFAQPIFHLRERMPDELMVQFAEILHGAMLKIALGIASGLSMTQRTAFANLSEIERGAICGS